jgi:hypothetical protein
VSAISEVVLHPGRDGYVSATTKAVHPVEQSLGDFQLIKTLAASAEVKR